METIIKKIDKNQIDTDVIREAGEILKKGDPYYNPNLSLARSDCSLRKKNE